MKYIAAQAGVSQATVSLCLANHPRIPSETREKIQAVALSLGYQPNPYVAALMRSRRRGKPLPGRPVLAIVCAYGTADGWRRSASRTVREIFEGVMAQAEARGYRGEEVWLRRDGMSDSRFSEILRARGIQGLVLGPLDDGARCPELAWKEFSAVRIGMPMREAPVRTICHDNYYASMVAVEECLQLGYRRPGLVIRRRHSDLLQRRWESGFTAAVAAGQVPAAIPPLVLEQWSDAVAFNAWYATHKPDALISPDHDAVAKLAAGLRLSVPRNLGIASLSSPESGSKVSGIFQNGHFIGASAVDLLIDLVERHERGLPAQATALMIEGQWNPGQTLRPRA